MLEATRMTMLTKHTIASKRPAQRAAIPSSPRLRIVSPLSRISCAKMSIDDVRAALSASPAGGRLSSDVRQRGVLAENAELVARMQRLTPVLVSMARDLACARRESAALERENRQLRSRLTMLEGRTPAARRLSEDQVTAVARRASEQRSRLAAARAGQSR